MNLLASTDILQKKVLFSDCHKIDLPMSGGGERLKVNSLLAGEGAQVVRSGDGLVSDEEHSYELVHY